MANLESIDIQPMSPLIPDTVKNVPEWKIKEEGSIREVPHVFFEDGEPWLAANSYALDKLDNATNAEFKASQKTTRSNMSHLKAYASWLEEQGLDWRHFPLKRKDRCLVRYRGHLITQRKTGQIAPSTATARMSAVIRFYRWAQVHGWIEKKALWEDHQKIVKFYSAAGFRRTMYVQSSELSIPNRKRIGLRLENGLIPLSKKDLDTLLKYLYEKGKVEIYLMHMLGAYSGARSETIRTMRISTIESATEDPLIKSISRIRIGGSTQVETKGGVHGEILCPTMLINELKRYAYSVRRLIRQSRAKKDNITTLFLTKNGNPYSGTSFTKLISDLRRELIADGISRYKDFHFHQTRATFGTNLMSICLKTMPSTTDAIGFVKDAMLHSDEATTWKYIKFIQQEPVKEALSNEFYRIFTGQTSEANATNLIKSAVYEQPNSAS